MTQENIIENTGAKYSEMLMQIVKEFDKKIPIELTFEETLELGIEAWNLANNKEFLINRNLYEQELTSHKNHIIVDEMVNYKIDHFSDFNNIIIDYSTNNNILQIKTQTRENHFNSMIREVINFKNITEKEL